MISSPLLALKKAIIIMYSMKFPLIYKVQCYETRSICLSRAFFLVVNVRIVSIKTISARRVIYWKGEMVLVNDISCYVEHLMNDTSKINVSH